MKSAKEEEKEVFNFKQHFHNVYKTYIYIYTFLQLLVLTAGRLNIIFMCVRLKRRYILTRERERRE